MNFQMSGQPNELAAEATDEAVIHLAGLFRLMGDPTRLRIILTCLNEPTSVGDIASRLDLSQSLVSHHLRLLRAARVLKGQRQGKQMFYSGDDAHIEHVVGDMLDHIREA
jgi:DNA-binding transcriptional ArsR family regulator